MRDDWDMIAIGIFLVIIVIVGMVQLVYEKEITTYEMPNGVICDDRVSHGGSRSEPSGSLFIDCNDEKEYINPESYEVIKK